MEEILDSLRRLTDEQLLAEVRMRVEGERTATGLVVASLAELDGRALYVSMGYSSLFAFCTRELHLSDKEAYSRIRAARAVRAFPVVLDGLADGALSLTNVTLLAPHLTTSNHAELLRAAQFKTRREVEQQIAALYPGRPRLVTWHLRVPAETDDILRRAKELLRHAVPTGDSAEVIGRALTLLVATLERKQLGSVSRPRRPRKAALGARHIPVAVRRGVWKRDDGRCAFVGTRGRCGETAFLEFHHVDPFALGGTNTIDNIQLRCRTHNQYEAQQDFKREEKASSGPALTQSRGRGP
jgi:5-methylcytosine-specific restriction endonuclease McrA